MHRGNLDAEKQNEKYSTPFLSAILLTLSCSRFLLSAPAFVFRLFRVGVVTVRACNVREENGKTTPACGRTDLVQKRDTPERPDVNKR